MELLGVTASVVGIVAFAIKGLEIICALREFCKEFPLMTKGDKVGTNEFLQNLDQSARILDDIRVLCEKIDRLFPNRISDFRIASLQLQVEDCTRDLQQILAATQQRGGSRRFRVFNEFLEKISKNQPSLPHERFRLHQENMRTALIITGRYLDAENSVKLHLVGGGVRQLTDRILNDIEERNRAIESLSSSGSAVLALSRSTSDRLQDVQCSTNDISADFQDMKELLLEVLSNSSSNTSSIYEERQFGNLSQNQERFPDPDNAYKESQKPNFRRRSSTMGSKHGKLELTDDRSEEDNPQQRANEKYEAEFNMVLRASKGLAKTVHRMYHPFLADYACTLYAWHTNEICARFMELKLPTGSWTDNFDGEKTSRKAQDVRQRAQTQILTLRKICITEGLKNDLGIIDAGMDLKQSEFEAWEKEEANRQRSSQCLLLTAPDAPVDQKKDRLTRINEWLLQVRESHQYLSQLHRNIWYSQTKQKSGSKSAPFLKNWERIILKYWFLDSAAMTMEEYATSSLSGGDSEATFKRFEDDSDVSTAPHIDLDEPLGYTKFVLMQPIYTSVTMGGEDAHPEILQSFIERPAGDFDLEVLPAAQKALAAYNEEPAVGF
ncbi:hypothetical protein B0J13DRAFT_605635 [Dactylonectria estremocensis]|uniref:Fungal N-terminal domain-containing protein n=1 Tax=Dactylonectria estremocensis TaxID=1079267 RepID=A0A9P9F285_9HYPO|nr:hypothetical protein B0J13DRAFT_605635 [Dactylonectria estremocensis]